MKSDKQIRSESMAAKALPATRQKEAVFLPSGTGTGPFSGGDLSLLAGRFWLPVGQPFRRQRMGFLPTKWEMIRI